MAIAQPLPDYDLSDEAELAPTPPSPMIEALEELAVALGELNMASENIVEKQNASESADTQIQRLAQDRATLARQLDTAQARADALKQVNEQVSKRLVAVMEKLRQLNLT